MSIIDWVIIIVIAGFVASGFIRGFIKTLGSLLSLALGVYVASRYFRPVYNHIGGFFLGFDRFGATVIFSVIYSVTKWAIDMGISFANRAFGLLSIVPFLGIFNRLFGALLAFLEAVLVLSLLIYLLAVNTGLPLVGDHLYELINKSMYAAYFLKAAIFLKPVVPGLITKIKNI